MKNIFLIISISFLLFGCVDENNVQNNPKNQNDSQQKLVEKEDGQYLSSEDQKKAEAEMEKILDEEEKKINEDYELVRELEDSEDAKKESKGAKGSCNDIKDSSTCLEYYGSFWNEDEMRLNCEGAGTFSFDPCPQDMAGGCNTGMGTMADLVAWMYSRGGGDIDAEAMGYAQKACESTPLSKWISR